MSDNVFGVENHPNYFSIDTGENAGKFVVTDTSNYVLWKQPEYDPWTCYLFGAREGEGISWTPEKGKTPNWFWRWMQYLAFGNRWVYKP